MVQHCGLEPSIWPGNLDGIKFAEVLRGSILAGEPSWYCVHFLSCLAVSHRDQEALKSFFEENSVNFFHQFWVGFFLVQYSKLSFIYL